MSWEAFRWTAKTPTELYGVLGPHGVDDLIRQALAACWRDLPDDQRTLHAAMRKAHEVSSYNLNVWRRIKQPTPEAFFKDLRPTNADGHFRQAMVLTWMMMPRSGGRKVSDALRIVQQILDRNLAAWRDDDATFTGKKAPAAKPKAKPKPTAAKQGAKKPAGKAGAARKKRK